MKFPVGIQDFESLIKDGYVYVDKTAYIYDLVNSGRYFFLSRPRRFGKSLLITTLESYFSGKKDLFKGLAIEKLEKDWTEYPVLHLDLNDEDYTQETAVTSVINRALVNWEEIYGSKDSENTLSGRFSGIIKRAYKKTGKKVVVLIDEYDKPLISTFDNPYLQNLYRAQLKAFYSVLKTMDGSLKFALLTGVTKFSKVSIFSDLNNLKDISMDENYVKLCGMTYEEIVANFDEEVGKMSDKHGITKEECYAQLKQMYDGYHFCENTEGIYNPFSVVNALDEKKFKNYWFETGTPTMLVQVMKACSFNFNDLEGSQITPDLLGSIDAMDETPLPLLYQTGYLTIEGYDKEFNEYSLNFPNKEVKSGFVNFLARFYRQKGAGSE
ncbi:MAG: AAA family ATPase [Treponema sp.]|nr:AAA family ATPase [Spirochaetales bacterium]MDY5811955.1 AAA family ATPase [Treponema sp.]